MDNELDGYEYDDSPGQLCSVRIATKTEGAIFDAVSRLASTIIAEIPESRRYGINLDSLEEMIYRRYPILNPDGNGLNSNFLDQIRDYLTIDTDIECVIQCAHWNETSLPRSLDEIVDDFFAEFESNGWNAYSHVEDNGKKGKHYLHIETIGISLVLYLRPNKYDDKDETPSYYIRYVETKNTSELPEWAQPKKDES